MTALARKAKPKPSALGHSWQVGRIAEDDQDLPLPRVIRAEVAAVEDWLAGHRNVRRPLTVAAPLLALVCALHKRQLHFPVRRRVAEWLRDNGHAEWTSERPNAVDKVIQVALALDEIEIHHAIEPGNTATHASVIRRRYLVPNAELLAAFDNATTTYGRAHKPGKKLATA